MKRTIRTALLALGMLATSLAAVRADEPDPAMRLAAERIAVGTCATCHGWRGYSTVPKFPVLAGQHANYLLAQMQAFKAQTRADPDALGYMWGMAAPLDDTVMAALADYYSRQAPRGGTRGDTALIGRGMQLYQQGDSAAGIPPCAACHGAAGEGTDMFPRLAGQHVEYLLKQLRSFQSNLRNVAIMHGVAQGLRSSDMLAVATYLQSLDH
jgi:cytochrome c553